MEKLPREIVLDIFYRLPPESVARCKFVCKSWRNLFLLLLLQGGDGNYFANMHLHRNHQRNLEYSTLNFISLQEIDFRDEEEPGISEFHITEYDEVENQLNCKVKRINFPQICGDSKTRLAGSCNGLLCLTRGYHSGWIVWDDRIGICNPLLNEYVHLPLSDLQFKHDYKPPMVIGFGHNPITDEYKVVRVYYTHWDLDIGDVEVYTLGKSNGMWRSKGTIGYRLLGCSRPVLVNGSLHWLATQTGREQQNVVSFDLEDEKFYVISLPSYTGGIANNFLMTSKKELKELRGCLCLIVERGSQSMDIWVLKEDYMNKKSWVREFSIKWEGQPLIHSPCAIKKKKDGDEILMWCNSKKLFSYDPKTRNCKVVRGRQEPTFGRDPVLHINSLVSLKALGEDAKESSKIEDIIWAKRMKKEMKALGWV